MYVDESSEKLRLSELSNALVRQHADCVISPDEAVHTPAPSGGHKAEQKKAAGRAKCVARPTAAASRPASKPASKPAAVPAPAQNQAADKKTKSATAAATKPVSAFVQALQHLDEGYAHWRQVSPGTNCMQGWILMRPPMMFMSVRC